jgi:hypothetical protein
LHDRRTHVEPELSRVVDGARRDQTVAHFLPPGQPQVLIT